jgi:hypothetical protein
VRERLCLYCPTALSRARALVDFGGRVFVMVAASSMVGVLVRSRLNLSYSKVR